MAGGCGLAIYSFGCGRGAALFPGRSLSEMSFGHFEASKHTAPSYLAPQRTAVIVCGGFFPKASEDTEECYCTSAGLGNLPFCLGCDFAIFLCFLK